ncbi:LysR family transcriptional regulator [Aquipseudomonas alcaligenes]|uniref:LysR family transcriptional regulator n=1 Tax=Aquipseudomonas alcaligenes TaxID=43263 RepID=UPI003749DD94
MARRFDHLGDVEAFLCVVERGSLSAASVSLGTTPSVISRAVSRLEARLGSQLLRRTTRRLSLTEDGRLYLEQARAAFALIDDAERRIQGGGEVAGRVRLSAPTTYGHYRLPQMLAQFALAYPQVQVELGISNRNVDLVAEGYDLAIRLGRLPDSGLVGRRLEEARLCLVAAPSYLARVGAPSSLADLERHACLPFIMPSSGKVAPWLFRDGEQELDWHPRGHVQVTDDVLGTVSLAEAGLGICQSYAFILHERIEQGRLVRLLPELEGRSRPFSIIYPPHRQLSPASRALIDFLAHAAQAGGADVESAAAI